MGLASFHRFSEDITFAALNSVAWSPLLLKTRRHAATRRCKYVHYLLSSPRSREEAQADARLHHNPGFQ